MTATKARKPRPAPALEVDLQAAPIAPCELFPRGLPGTVLIGGGEYALSYHGELPEAGEPVIDGYRLVKPDGTSYDLPADADSCECLGSLRWGRCKHAQAVRQLRQAGQI